MQKSLKFIYEGTEIHFLVNPTDTNVMINATEMAKLFNKRVSNFLRLDETKLFIKELLKNLNILSDVSGYNESDIVNTNNKAGTYMHRKLALKFATWLDVEFELWVFDTIDQIIFGNYKKHWEAHVKQEAAKAHMYKLKDQLLSAATVELAQDYFIAEYEFKAAKLAKLHALKDQYQLKLFGE